MNFCFSRSVPSDLPTVCFIAQQIEHVVGDLKGHAQMMAVAVERFADVRLGAGVMAPSRQQQASNAAVLLPMIDDVLVLAKIEVAPAFDLPQFAVADGSGGLAQFAARRTDRRANWSGTATWASR